MWIGRILGVDVRTAGSGNTGATNVGRTVGALPGISTLLLDAAKGAIPVLVVGRYGATTSGLALVGLSTVVGHVFSIFARFRGGKGVATAFGVFLALAPAAAGCAFFVFVAMAFATRFVSLASMLAGAALPVSLAVLGDYGPRFWLGMGVAALLIATHRDNLGRLLSGTEPRFSAKKS